MPPGTLENLNTGVMGPCLTLPSIRRLRYTPDPFFRLHPTRQMESSFNIIAKIFYILFYFSSSQVNFTFNLSYTVVSAFDARLFSASRMYLYRLTHDPLVH